jgi:hypothetical protein
MKQEKPFKKQHQFNRYNANDIYNALTPLLREGRPADRFKMRRVSASHFDSACVKAWGQVSGHFSSPFGCRSQ